MKRLRRWQLLYLAMLGLRLFTSMSMLAFAEKPPCYDVYLTFRRICRGCCMQALSATHVRLVNQAGEEEIVLVRDILGVDAHPVQRKVLEHFTKHLNPISMHYLLPDAHFGVGNDFYGHYGKPPFVWDEE